MDFSPLIISLKVSISATIISLIVALFCVYFTKFSKPKYKNICESILTIPLILPPSVLGLVLLLTFGANSFIGKFLAIFNINIIFTIYASIIASIIVTLPLMYRSIAVSIDELDKTIIEEARLVGCSDFYLFKHIVIPLSTSGIVSGVILSFLRSLGEFGTTLMISGNIPGKTQNISTTIYFSSISDNMNIAIFWAVFLILFSLCFIILSNKFSTSKNF